MKKMFLSAIVMTGIFSACTKKDVVPTSSASTSTTKPQAMMSSLRVYYDNGGVGPFAVYGCSGVGGNCLNDVVIRPRVNQLFNLVYSGGNYNGYIRANKEDLALDIPESYLDGVVNNMYTLAIRGEQGQGTQYLKFVDAKGEVAMVLPGKQ